jgi:hypothetical protein
MLEAVLNMEVGKSGRREGGESGKRDRCITFRTFPANEKLSKVLIAHQ